MAWQSVFPIMVRNLIGDITTPQKYTDDQLNETVAVAGLIVSQEFPFLQSYTFDLESPDILPDPTEPNSPTQGPEGYTGSPTRGTGYFDPSAGLTFDPNAIALFSLKAACMLTTNAFIGATGKGIRVRDGDSEVDTTQGLRSYADIIRLGPCASYKELLQKLYTMRGQNLGKAVMSPYSTGGALYGNRSAYGNWSPISFFNVFLRY